jgi:hypothetical protein
MSKLAVLDGKPKVVLFGTGYLADLIFAHLNHQFEIVSVVDNNSAKHGGTLKIGLWQTWKPLQP